MSSRNLSARQPAKNIATKPPTRVVTTADGTTVREKLSPLWGMKMVAPDGDVTFVTLSSGYTIRGLRNNPEGQRKLEERLKAGFLPYAECPVATKRMEGSDPCAGEFSESKCCPHLEKVIAHRRKDYRAKQSDYLASFANQTERLLEYVKSRAAAEAAAGDKPERKARIGG